MKIVYFIDHLRPDGTQHVLTQLAGGLAERGHQQAVICLNNSWDERVVDDLRTARCEIRILGKLSLVSGVGLLSTRSWLRQNRFDVAVTMLFAADVFGRLLAHSAGVNRVVTSLRARNVNYTVWQRWLVKRTSIWADRVVINSQGIRDFAIHEEGIDPERIYLIPNAISMENLDRGTACKDIRDELALDPQAILIGTAGRLSYQKGIDVLIKAVALIPVSELHILIMGEGELEGTLRNLSKSYDLESRVHFLGYRDDLPQLLGGLDVYVQPSRFEGMPNALMEAIAAGCPAVASAVDGNLELIEGGVTGLLFPSEHAEALKEALMTLLSDRDRANAYSNAARLHLIAKYSLSDMILAWERVLAGADVVR